MIEAMTGLRYWNATAYSDLVKSDKELPAPLPGNLATGLSPQDCRQSAQQAKPAPDGGWTESH